MGFKSDGDNVGDDRLTIEIGTEFPIGVTTLILRIVV
jgi:hypothetical protein